MKTRSASLTGSMILLLLIAFFQLLHSLPLTHIPYLQQVEEHFVMLQAFNHHHLISFVLGLWMLLIYHALWKKMRLAWIVELLLLFSALILQTVFFHWSILPLMLAEFLCFLVLLKNDRAFQRRSSALRLKGSLLLILIVFSSLFFYTLLSLLLLHRDSASLGDIIKSTLRLQFLWDQGALLPTSGHSQIYIKTLMFTNILLMSMAMILAFIPQLVRLRGRGDRQKLVQLIQAHGQNPMSYLALEDDKDYFFSRGVDGVAAFNKVGKVMTICGDPIVEAEHMQDFLLEIIAYCVQNGLSLLLLNCNERFLDLYRELDFGILHLGEDAILDLQDFSLAGGARAKVRAAIHHAQKAGVKVVKYDPLTAKNAEIEEAMRRIDEAWLAQKKGMAMRFMMGSANLDDPLERRYYYALQDEKMLGYVVFFPYENKKAWLAEVIRRLPGAPQGVMESLIVEGFQALREEGAEWGNLGLSPLYHEDLDESTITQKAMDLIYEKGGSLYDFKGLHHAKDKYHPRYESRYLVFLPKPLSLNMALALIKVQTGVPLLQLVKDLMRP